MASSLVHVAVEKAQLEGIVKCEPGALGLLVSLLERLGPLVDHPNLMEPHAIDSIGKYLDEARFDEMRARLVSGNGVSLVYRVRKFDVITCDAADKLPSAQRRQCVAVRGTHEMARRLEPNERGAVEVVASFPGGATLSVRQNRNAHRLVVICTDTNKVRKVLDAVLGPDDAPWLEHFFEEAARGQRQVAAGPSVATRLVKLENGSAFWELPAWYAEKVAQLAQEVFRLHAFVSAISQNVSRALFVDRVTAHRLTRGQPEDHRTLIKGAMHRASGGCACLLHKSAAPAERFVRLEFRLEFCGCTLGANGRCPTHSLAEHTPQSAKFPGVCMLGLKVELRCAHDQASTGATGGVRLPLDVRDNKMDLAFARPFVMDVASCGARLMLPDPPYADMQLDAEAAFADLNDLRLQHAHAGDQILQRDMIAVYLLRKRTRLHKTGRFAGRVSAECSAILKTHKHLFKTNVS